MKNKKTLKLLILLILSIKTFIDIAKSVNITVNIEQHSYVNINIILSKIKQSNV